MTNHSSCQASLPTHIRLGRAICGELEQAERAEWWLSNGIGGYAAGTVADTLTRRYHGLLIAPVEPPLGRRLVFAKADATLLLDGKEYPLHTNRWGDGAIAPHGYLYLESFYLDGRMPVWRYHVAGHVVEKRVWMEPGANTTYLAYRLVTATRTHPAKAFLRVSLLVNARDHHDSTRPWQYNPVIENDENELRVVHPNWISMTFRVGSGKICSAHDWIENFDLPLERERGLPDRDYHLCVGNLTLDCDGGDWVGFAASLEDKPSPYVEEAMRRFQAQDLGNLARAKLTVPQLTCTPAWIDQLLLSANSFLFARPTPGLENGESVIAGYPWFGDWGRDTMIALPGLTLATAHYDSARRILQTFARFVDQGMLPNVFPGAGEHADYNTVDAALWYFHACRAYMDTVKDMRLLHELYPVLIDIIDWHIKGTRYGIGVDAADGLLRAGEAGVQLTWMDAKVGDWVVTPRIGKPVEINALWYNALNHMSHFATLLEQDPEPYDALAEQVQKSFSRFLMPSGEGLFDVIDGSHGDDATLRPNQIFAVSLPYSPLNKADQAVVVDLCRRELLTSYGLRSLSPNHADYRPYYQGGVCERDGAYHQGPVWGWLLGHFALAEYHVYGDASQAQARLEPMRDHLADAGLGTISEIFDGAAPHHPRGCPSQAWSVACTLEAWWQLEQKKHLSKNKGNHHV